MPIYMYVEIIVFLCGVISNNTMPVLCYLPCDWLTLPCAWKKMSMCKSLFLSHLSAPPMIGHLLCCDNIGVGPELAVEERYYIMGISSSCSVH